MPDPTTGDRERADSIVRDWHYDEDATPESLADLIAEALAEKEAQTREECARVADVWEFASGWTIASRIRALAQKETKP